LAEAKEADSPGGVNAIGGRNVEDARDAEALFFWSGEGGGERSLFPGVLGVKLLKAVRQWRWN
jgi:hypothetical protein